MTQTTAKDSVLIPYTGISFPFRVGPKGRIAVSTTSQYEIQHIIESVQQIVGTRGTPVGERYIIRDFGGQIPPLVFEPINPAGLQIIKGLVTRAIGRWEPRVIVRHVEVVDIDAMEGKVTVEIDLYVKRTQKIVTHQFAVGGTVADTLIMPSATLLPT